MYNKILMFIWFIILNKEVDMRKIVRNITLCAIFALIFGLGSCANQPGSSDTNTPAETPDAPDTPVYPSNGNLTKPEGDNLTDVFADLDLSGTWKLVHGYLYVYLEDAGDYEIELTSTEEIAEYIESWWELWWETREDAPKFDAECCVKLSPEYANEYFGYIVEEFDFLDAIIEGEYILDDIWEADIKESWCIISKDRKKITLRMNFWQREHDFNYEVYADGEVNAAIIYEKQS